MQRRALPTIMAASGLALLLLGFVLSAAGGLGGHVVAIALGLGAGLVLLGVAPAAGSLRAVLRGRAARRGADAALAAILFTALLVVVQATSMRHSRQVDLTRNQRHTLAPQTMSILTSLDREVEATAFFRTASPMRDGAVELLGLYARRSPRFRYRVVDPDRQPDLAERLGARPEEIVLACGERRSVARTTGEAALTNALLQVTRHDPPVVYFVTGHGEKDITSTSRDGYAAAARDLEAQGYAARPLSLVATSAVPADAAVVVVAGPRDDYLESEVETIRTHQLRGGSVLFMLDPRRQFPRLGELLAWHHLTVLDAVVLDESELRSGDRTFDATVTKVRRYEPHAITRGFNYLTMYPRARPVYIPVDSSASGVNARYLAITDDTSWGEINMTDFAAGRASRDGDDIAGPLPVAAVSERRPPGRPDEEKSRVVLVGDSDFANNVFYGLLGNPDFFQNIIAFLAREEDMITIRPRGAPGDRVYISERQGRLVFAVCIVLLPLASVVAGGVVAVRRRRL